MSRHPWESASLVEVIINSSVLTINDAKNTPPQIRDETSLLGDMFDIRCRGGV